MLIGGLDQIHLEESPMVEFSGLFFALAAVSWLLDLNARVSRALVDPRVVIGFEPRLD